MTDIYAKPVIIDIENGKTIPNNSFETETLLDTYLLGYNFQAEQFNKEIDSWNEEFDRLYPDIYNDLNNLVNQKIYNNFIVERWQKIIDQFNNVASAYVDGLEFVIEEDLNVTMLDGLSHKIRMELVNSNN